MPNYKVTSAAKLKDRESQYGVFTDYMLMLTDEQGVNTAAELSQKQSSTAPKAGDTLSGTIEQTAYGPKFKKDKPAYGGAGVAPRDPETQRYIMRQNALTTAVNRGICKVEQLCKFAKDAKAVEKILDEELSGKHLIQVAGLLAKFSEGMVTVVMTQDEVAKIFAPADESAPQAVTVPEKAVSANDEPEITTAEAQSLLDDEPPFN